MTRTRGPAAVAGFALCAWLVVLVAAPATATRLGAVAPFAPEYVSSEPEDGEKLHQAPDSVTATFSEPLDPGSEMIVEDHCGNKLDDGNVEVSLNEMSVGIAKKPSGHYMVTYAADGIGGATGSTQGRFSFVVHAGEPCDGGAGGHGGHGGSGGGGGGHGGRGNEHTGGQAGSGEHAGMDNGSTGTHPDTHDGAADMHGGHRPGDAGEASGAHSGHGAGKSDGNDDERDLTGIAAGETPLPDLRPDSTAVLLALVICAAFGGLGGWLLRVSARR